MRRAATDGLCGTPQYAIRNCPHRTWASQPQTPRRILAHKPDAEGAP